MCKLKDEESAESAHKVKEVMEQLKTFFNANYEVRYNVVTNQTEIRKQGSKDDFKLVDKRVMNTLIIEALNAEIDCMDRDVKRYLDSLFIPETHPMKNYMDSLPRWDGKDRVSELAALVNCEKWWQSLFHRWMLSMVHQWITPKPLHGNSLMPILISQEQGKMKSTFCRLILPEELRQYYTDEFDVDSRSNVTNKLAHFALINIDEFNRMNESKCARLKNILQMTEVNIKAWGGGFFKRAQRIASFIGTCNFREILSDPTGARRFIPIDLDGNINFDKIDYKQIYAQLKSELMRRRQYWLSPKEEKRLTERNIAYSKRPIEEPIFRSCFEIPKEDEKNVMWLSISQIYETLRKKSHSTMRDISMDAFSKHLAMLGVNKKRKHLGYLYCLRKI